jgi:hypothetical protein
VRADAARITPADLPVLARAGERIRAAMADDDAVAPQGVEKSGSLDSQAKALAARVAPLAGIQPVPLLLVAVIGLVTLAELARLLDGVRLRETALLRSRGASAARVGLTTAVEALIVSGVGAAVGAGFATGLLLAFGRHPLAVSNAVSITLAVVVAAVVLVAGVAFNSARLAFRRDTADDSGRGRRLAAPGLVVLLVAAAGLSLWRYLQFGSPLSPTSTGAAVDPIAVLAPALCLAAIAVLCLAVFPALVRLVENAAARGNGARLTLAARQLARRARMTASPVVLIALAGGGLVVAACYAPTWQAGEARTAALHAGADLVVTDVQATDARAIAKLPGVDGAASAVEFSWRDDAGNAFNLSALGAAGIRSAVAPVHGVADPATLATSVAAPMLGAKIADGATTLSFTTTVVGMTPELHAIVIDANGIGTSLPIALGPGGTAVASLPPGPGRRLVAVDVSVPAISGQIPDIATGTTTFLTIDIAFRVDRIVAVGPGGATSPVDIGAAWKPVAGSLGDNPAGNPVTSGPLGFTQTGVGGIQAIQLRLTPPGVQQVPIAVSRPFAAATKSRRGTQLTFDLSGGAGGPMNAKVAAVLPQVPGAQGDDAAFTDLAALQTQRVMLGSDPLAVDRVWVRTGSPHDVASAIEHAVGGAHVSGPAVDSGGHVLDAVPVALWLGMSSGALLALIALAAVAGELLRMRSDEVSVLRALGMSPRTLARLRQWELAAACLAAAAGALLSGGVVSALVVPGLARVAIEHPLGGLRQPLRIDVISLGVAAAGMAVVVAGVIAVYGARIAQQARTIADRETAR